MNQRDHLRAQLAYRLYVQSSEIMSSEELIARYGKHLSWNSPQALRVASQNGGKSPPFYSTHTDGGRRVDFYVSSEVEVWVNTPKEKRSNSPMKPWPKRPSSEEFMEKMRKGL